MVITVDFPVRCKASWLMDWTSGELFMIVFTLDKGSECFDASDAIFKLENKTTTLRECSSVHRRFNYLRRPYFPWKES